MMIVARISNDDDEAERDEVGDNDEAERNEVGDDDEDRIKRKAVRESVTVSGAQEKAIGGAANRGF